MSTRSAHEKIDIDHRVAIAAVRIERDYSRGDGITRFSTDIPTALADRERGTMERISTEQFQNTVETINRLLEQAERLTLRVVFDNVMELLTFYTWPLLFRSHYQKSIERLLQFVEQENEKVYHPHSLSLSNPVRSAFLFLEIKIYDDTIVPSCQPEIVEQSPPQ